MSRKHRGCTARAITRDSADSGHVGPSTLQPDLTLDTEIESNDSGVAENEDINVRRDCVLRCLSIYLNEDLDTLVKEYMEVNPLSSEEPEDTVGRVLASKSLHYAKDDSFRSNNKDACCGLSAYELQRLENIKEKEAFLSSLKIWQAAEDMRQSVKPKTHVKRSKALLVKEQFMHSPRKSLRLKEPQNLTLSEGSAHKHDIESREAEADIGEKTMGIYTVQAEVDVPGDGRFADVGVVLEGGFTDG
uniref:Uncharacterized protein n=1 Tax=Knipowitschia caucasica TaxID=637954 RepID=A0AAV2KX09_KNICA